MKTKQKEINEHIFKELKVNRILNQIDHAIAGLRYDASKEIINAILNNQKVSIQIIIDNKSKKIYDFNNL